MTTVHSMYFRTTAFTALMYVLYSNGIKSAARGGKLTEVEYTKYKYCVFEESKGIHLIKDKRL